MASPPQREIREGELIDSVANAEKAKTFTEQIEAATSTASDQATVAGQLAGLTANFDATNPPAWASRSNQRCTSSYATKRSWCF